MGNINVLGVRGDGGRNVDDGKGPRHGVELADVAGVVRNEVDHAVGSQDTIIDGFDS